MSAFVPNLIIKDVTKIDVALLEKHCIKALILDVDNTLTVHGSQLVQQDVLNWIDLMKQSGIKLFLVSNNSNSRIDPFAKKIGLDYIAMGMKPLTFGFSRAIRTFNLETSSVAVVGDQIYTDILGGNLRGLFTIMVTPFELEDNNFFKLKRVLEKTHIKKYYRKGGAYEQ